ncbi:DUF2573 family protein [Bacillus sp. E(2018)]|uniref:DUF2573 family protein n=1 Tax=Bacillus sp. E(2018) TaxID=2502239 RepID=UPI0010F60615|nr:DUF2573 family protein [Bacillus sp. E(2018)]
MDDQLKLQLDGLIEKYAELLLGSSDPDYIEMVKTYALYSFIAKSMPPLVKHWNDEYPDAKQAMKNLVHEIKELNEKHRNEQK